MASPDYSARECPFCAEDLEEDPNASRICTHWGPDEEGAVIRGVDPRRLDAYPLFGRSLEGLEQSLRAALIEASLVMLNAASLPRELVGPGSDVVGTQARAAALVRLLAEAQGHIEGLKDTVEYRHACNLMNPDPSPLDPDPSPLEVTKDFVAQAASTAAPTEPLPDDVQKQLDRAETFAAMSDDGTPDI